MTGGVGAAFVGGIAHVVETERDTILHAWRARIGTLPTSRRPSLAANGARVLDWLAAALRHGGAGPEDLPIDETFSAPRAIAELALLTETIECLSPTTTDDAARESLHRVIDRAIEHSLARDSDDAARLRTRLRLASDVTLVGSWELDPSTGLVVMDARSRELFSALDDDQPTIDALTSRLHADDREAVRAGIAQTLGSKTSYHAECRTLRPVAGSFRWIAIAVEAHEGLGSSSPILIGIVHDITASKRAKEENARLVEELSRAVHISEMFVGILSHDLRNPLSAILGGADLLKLGARDEKVIRILGLVTSSGARMGRMIDQLLDFTRARLGEGIPLHPEATDLETLAGDTIEEAKSATATSPLRLSVTGDPSGSWDRDRICQVLSNLVGNAVAHAAPGGVIVVIIDGTHAEYVRLTTQNAGSIPGHMLPVIFNPFRGTAMKRGASSGLGLGLYVARQIALAHGGDLTVETNESTTTFQLVLPRIDRRALPSRANLVREEELAAFEHLSAPASANTITARMFGGTPLNERTPVEYSAIVARYSTLLDAALQRKAFRGHREGLAEDVRAIAERLGRLNAGPREVTDVHARALREAVRGATAAKAQAMLVEGRLLALELMGHLASFYRRRFQGLPNTPLESDNE